MTGGETQKDVDQIEEYRQTVTTNHSWLSAKKCQKKNQRGKELYTLNFFLVPLKKIFK